MHDCFTPLGGLVPLFNMQTGEVIFGGVGAGLYGMLIFAILAVFIAGLMVGRTPEYLGKKIEPYEVKMAMLALLVMPLVDPRASPAVGAVDRRRRLVGRLQRRAARAVRDPLRVHLGGRQ